MEAILLPARARLSGSLRLQKLFSRQSGHRSWRGLLSRHCRGCYKNKRLFPSGEALPSTTSAGSCLPLFGRFLGTTTSSDFSPAYMLGVRLLPSRAGPAHVRARMRPPRFRAKNFPTCTRSPTARGSLPCKPIRHGRCCLLFLRIRSAPRN